MFSSAKGGLRVVALKRVGYFCLLENKKGMVSLGLCNEGSGKPAILSTTIRSAKRRTQSWVYTQRPTPDRCECSSYSLIAGLMPQKNLPDFSLREQEYYSNSMSYEIYIFLNEKVCQISLNCFEIHFLVKNESSCSLG